MKKILSVILAVVLLAGVFALEAGAALDPVYVLDDEGKKTDVIDYKATVEQYLDAGHLFTSDKAKLDTMTLKYEKNGYQLYADEFTGEVATVNLATGQVLFTNPRDIASGNAAYANTTKYELMSQLIVKYNDNGTEKIFNSFEQAAMNGQIDVKTIKNGLRVEYTIGREDTKYLVPRVIEKERFETNILDVLAQEIAIKTGATVEEVQESVKRPQARFFDYFKLWSYYLLKDPNSDLTDRELQEMQNQFPITKKAYNGQLMAVYICSAETGQELREVESRIKTYCPQYTFEQLEYDHELTEYVKNDRAPALFKMALEYRLDGMGLTVRLPANGIRFNEGEYQLTDISILPWMGAGSNDNTGYTFFPDGSGALFRFEDLNDGRTHTVAGNIYGQDYAYHTITGTHQEIIRYPVFGIVNNRTMTTSECESIFGDAASEAPYVPTAGEKTMSTGFVAILEEGDALAQLELKHYGAVSKYNTVYVKVNPRPRDQYVLSDAVSVGGNNSVTVVSKRKYVGDYKIRYMMLTDTEVAEKKNIADFYEATWIGMATAYRNYLASPYSTGTQNLSEDQQRSVLNRLTSADIKEDIPLYIETFGSIETVKKVLSIPVNTKVALTSFDNIQEMYSQLSEVGIDNVNFKLTGYYNGGMYSSVPYKLNFEKSVGGKKGFKELISDAKDRGYGVYLDFDFAYATASAAKSFDGLSNRKDLVKAIDDRYTSKQYYSATRQSYTSYFELAISPSRFAHFYDKVSEEYLSYNPIGISLSTVASDLNSDFDEDEPYNREDSKKFTIDLFKKIDNDYSSVMADSANAYTWAYIDHMINAAVDSSRYVKASNSVPFLGAVLHGYVQFAGTPMNMEGNIGYAMLKAIENGSGLYFILSYDNTELLKNDEQLSQYYSVRYDIWFDELVERYNSVNDVLKDLQTMLIINHEFLIGERVPDADELEADRIEAEKKEEADKLAKEEADRIALINQIREGRYTALANTLSNMELINEMLVKFYDSKDPVTSENVPGLISQLKSLIKTLEDKNYFALVDEAQAVVDAAQVEKDAAQADYDAATLAIQEAKDAYNAAKKAAGKKPTAEQIKYLNSLYEVIENAETDQMIASSVLNQAKKDLSDAQAAYDELQKDEDFVQLGKTNQTVGDNIEIIKRYMASMVADAENVLVAYTELTRKDADGNYSHSQAIIDDITYKYNKVNEINATLDKSFEDMIALYREVYDVILEYYPDQDHLTEKEEEPEEEKKEEEGYNYTKYTNDDGNIVAVTYGENGVAYRTFILNYNFFEVTTSYNGKDYTVPAFGYIIIEG